MKVEKIFFISFFLIITSCIYAQEVNFEKAENLTSDRLGKFIKNSYLRATWDEKGSRFLYSCESEKGNIYYIVDLPRKSKELLPIDGAFEEKLNKLSSKKYNRYTDLIYLKFDKAKEKRLLFSYSGENYSYDLSTLKVKKIEVEQTQRRYQNNRSGSYRYSPDSTYYLFARNHNLYIQKYGLSEDSAVQLTDDGIEFYSYTSSSAYKKNEDTDLDKVVFPGTVFWTEDPSKFLVLREDKRKVGEMTVINSLKEPRPTTSTYKFPMPGDKDVPQFELFIFDAISRKKIKVNIEKYPDQKIEFALSPYQSTPRYFFFLRKSRTCDKVDLCRLDIRTGEFKELFSDTSYPHINVPLFACHILNEGKDILWWSERTGKGQYYLYDRDGNLKNRITERDFVAGRIHSIDTIGRSFIFAAYGDDKNVDPCYQMYYKATFDGNKTTLLTPGDGYHDIDLSPNRRYLIDTYSRMDMPSKREVRDINGKLILPLEEVDITELLNNGFKYPKIIKLKAADGLTDLYGVMYMPSDIDTTRQYPIIANVYPGPIEDYVPKSFTIDDNYDQSLSELGFIVINVGYRGANPYRGRDFHCYGYDNLRDYPLDDCKSVITQLANQYSFIDINRVGIYGHSGGGFMAATAILKYPDFFKVAVAASGNHDNRIYTQYWGETYHGVHLDSTTVNDSVKYNFTTNIPTNLELAKNLKGRLFLITGDVDVNVHPAQTFRLANELIKANKRFDMMVLPGRDHGLGGAYYINLIRYYFVENLLRKPQQNIDIVNHK